MVLYFTLQVFVGGADNNDDPKFASSVYFIYGWMPTVSLRLSRHHEDTTPAVFINLRLYLYVRIFTYSHLSHGAWVTLQNT